MATKENYSVNKPDLNRRVFQATISGPKAYMGIGKIKLVTMLEDDEKDITEVKGMVDIIDPETEEVTGQEEQVIDTIEKEKYILGTEKTFHCDLIPIGADTFCDGAITGEQFIQAFLEIQDNIMAGKYD